MNFRSGYFSNRWHHNGPAAIKVDGGDIRYFFLTKTMEGIHKSHTKTFLNVAINYHNRYTEYQYN